MYGYLIALFKQRLHAAERSGFDRGVRLVEVLDVVVKEVGDVNAGAVLRHIYTRGAVEKAGADYDGGVMPARGMLVCDGNAVGGMEGRHGGCYF